MFDVSGSKTTSKSYLEKIGKGDYPYITTQAINNGIAGFYNYFTEQENCLTIDSAVLGTCFWQNKNFSASDHVEILRPKNFALNQKIALFFTSLLNKNASILGYSYGMKRNQSRIKNENILLPITTDGKIDFDFMESFIAELEAERVRELEAYLKAADLADTTLSADEQNALNTLNSKIWQEFKFKDIFNNIKQGRRVKKDDQIDGDIPFIMSGITNTGFVKNISNPIEIYPKNSITIDIFGNTFYRNYVYGAGDDTGIYWNDMKDYSKLVMLFFATSMTKSVYGKFDFGKKLRSSQSLDFTMKLPITTNGEIDFDFMESFIKAIQKECIKGVDSYLSKNIATTKEVINN